MAYEIANTIVITDASNGIFSFAVAKRIAKSTRAFVQHVSGIDMFPFASYGSKSSLLSPFSALQARAGSSSSTHGYIAGGGNPSLLLAMKIAKHYKTTIGKMAKHMYVEAVE